MKGNKKQKGEGRKVISKTLGTAQRVVKGGWTSKFMIGTAAVSGLRSGHFGVNSTSPRILVVRWGMLYLVVVHVMFGLNQLVPGIQGNNSASHLGTSVTTLDLRIAEASLFPESNSGRLNTQYHSCIAQ